MLADGVVISTDDNPELRECLGDTIITADGTTLLGADDKAGIVAAICASPAIVLAKRGLLDGKRATCYPGFEERFGPSVTRVDCPSRCTRSGELLECPETRAVATKIVH